MATPQFPSSAEGFYASGDYYLGKSRIFNPYMNVGRLSPEQKLFRHNPLLNYGMSYPNHLPPEGQPMTPDQRFASQVRLVINTVSHLGDVRNGHILEVGSGTGSGAYIVDRVFQPGCLSGVDFSAEQVDRAREMNSRNGRINFHQLNAGEIATLFGERQFDGIYSVEMAQHLTREVLVNFIGGAYKTLKPEKKLSFCTFFNTDEGSQPELKKMFPTADMGLDHMHNIRDVESIMEQSGFTNVQAISIGNLVWGQLVRWCRQVAPEQTWFDVFLTAFPDLLDYYIVTGKKQQSN
jgi:SAM-dependent methyltransferase